MKNKMMNTKAKALKTQANSLIHMRETFIVQAASLSIYTVGFLAYLVFKLIQLIQ